MTDELRAVINTRARRAIGAADVDNHLHAPASKYDIHQGSTLDWLGHDPHDDDFAWTTEPGSSSASMLLPDAFIFDAANVEPPIWTDPMGPGLSVTLKTALAALSGSYKAAIAEIVQLDTEPIFGKFTTAQAPAEPRIDPAVATRFEELADQWRRETAMLSSIQEIVIHPAYQRIMAMGKPAIPLVLRRLRDEGGYWFWALLAMADLEHDPAAALTRHSDARRAWLQWGNDQGLI